MDYLLSFITKVHYYYHLSFSLSLRLCTKVNKMNKTSLIFFKSLLHIICTVIHLNLGIRQNEVQCSQLFVKDIFTMLLLYSSNVGFPVLTPVIDPRIYWWILLGKFLQFFVFVVFKNWVFCPLSSSLNQSPCVKRMGSNPPIQLFS